METFFAILGALLFLAISPFAWMLEYMGDEDDNSFWVLEEDAWFYD